jgi:hypothetical protein
MVIEAHCNEGKGYFHTRQCLTILSKNNKKHTHIHITPAFPKNATFHGLVKYQVVLS